MTLTVPLLVPLPVLVTPPLAQPTRAPDLLHIELAYSSY
jgi:hypothetical protein